ncbi:MAG: DNA primase, partial [Candidatus Absconditabacteria bacterium]
MSTLNDDILANIDIVDIVSRYVNLKKVGSNYSGLCPFHREKTPSFVVAQDKQIFKCFGCGIGGNLIKFFMEIEKLDYWDSVKLLAKEANIEIEKYQNDQFVGKNSFSEKEKIKLINKRAQEYFTANLKESKLPLDYLHNDRKLTDNIISSFGLGFAPNSVSGLVNYLKGKGFTLEDIVSFGFGKKSNSGEIYSFFRNRIIFPIKDHTGSIVAFAGRSLNSQDMPKYLNSPESIVYDKSNLLYGLDNAKNGIRDFKRLIVLEGYMDVIGLARAGINIGVASCGTALTPGHIKHIKRFTDNLVLGFDNDEAGFEATKRALKVAYQYDVFPNVLVLPYQYKDVDEYVNYLTKTNEIDKFKKFIIGEEVELQVSIIDGFDYVYNVLTKKHSIASVIERKKVIAELFEIIKSLSDVSVQMMYVERMANNLKINFDLLRGQYRVFVQGKEKFLKKSPPNKDLSKEDKYRLGAILMGDYLKNNYKLDDKVYSYFDFLKNLLLNFESSFEKNILQGNISSEDRGIILESQLLWEKDLQGISEDKVNQIFLTYLTSQIQKFIQLFNKITVDPQVKVKTFQAYHNQKIVSSKKESVDMANDGKA